MKITAISAQTRNPDRVNVSVDGKYRFSLDIFQVTELGIKVGQEYSEDELLALEQESVFGKLYARALEYTMLRPHSEKEVRDYLWRKTRPTRRKDGSEKPGVAKEVADRVLARLKEKGYINDSHFARFWFENRSLRKGASQRKLISELRAKGVDQQVIDEALHDAPRNERQELQKVIAKKSSRYESEEKFIQYLMRQGFSYDLIKEELSKEA